MSVNRKTPSTDLVDGVLLKRVNGVEPSTFSLEGGKPPSQPSETTSTYEHGKSAPSDTPSDWGAISTEDADLGRVIVAWPTLSESVRSAIITLILHSNKDE